MINRADANHFIVLLALVVNQVPNQIRYPAMETDRSVIGAKEHILGHLAHLIFEHQEIGRTGTQDHIAGHALFMHPFHLGIHRSGRKTTGHEQDIAFLHFGQIFMNKVRRSSERPDHILKAVAYLKPAQFLGRSPQHLEHDADSPFFPIVIANSQRNTFPLLVRDHNQELSRLGGFRQTGSVHLHADNLRCDCLLL